MNAASLAIASLLLAACSSPRSAAGVPDGPVAAEPKQGAGRTAEEDSAALRLYAIALNQAKEGMWDDALTSLDRSIRLAPDYADAHFERGVVLEAMGLPDEALSAYDKVEALSPAHGDLHYNRGVCYSELREWDAALAAYERAIAQDPTFSYAYTNRSEALLRLGRIEEAAESAATAVSIDGTDTLAHQLLGVAHLNSGRPAEALAAFEYCAEQEPWNGSHAFNSALALEDLGRTRDALEVYGMMMELFPDHPGAPQARKDLLQRIEAEGR